MLATNTVATLHLIGKAVPKQHGTLSVNAVWLSMYSKGIADRDQDQEEIAFTTCALGSVVRIISSENGTTLQ